MKTENSLGAYLSPLAVVALSFGYAVGWGSFVMPGNVFLPDAGPADMVLGILAGAGLAKAIRADARLAALPVHVVTADVELQETYAAKGFDRIVLKPVTVDALRSLFPAAAAS